MTWLVCFKGQRSFVDIDKFCTDTNGDTYPEGGQYWVNCNHGYCQCKSQKHSQKKQRHCGLNQHTYETCTKGTKCTQWESIHRWQNSHSNIIISMSASAMHNLDNHTPSTSFQKRHFDHNFRILLLLFKLFTNFCFVFYKGASHLCPNCVSQSAGH